ncbi:MAG TPA: hypothetical protein VF832_12120, partial [Longimicrobiales bacterium]
GNSAASAETLQPQEPEPPARADTPAEQEVDRIEAPPDVAAPKRLEENTAPEPAPGAPTVAGGLFFLLNVLTRLGHREWVEAQPAWAEHDIARRMLAQVLGRLAVPEDDPAWAIVAARPPRRPPPARFLAPPRWRDGLLSGMGPLRLTDTGRLFDPSGRLLLGAWHGALPGALLADCRRALEVQRTPRALDEDVVDAWLVASRRWLRRYAGLGLADVVLRQARVTATPTHVDVTLDLHDADLRVRRAGLDLDPGWVPWFGRVVAFHYEQARQP